MSYDLHITRRRRFWDAGKSISEDEYKTAIQSHPKLRELVHWFEGAIDAPAADLKSLPQLLQLAKRLSASVQGDDLETYVSDDGQYRAYRPTLGEHVAAFLGKFSFRRDKLEPPFEVGDRVYDSVQECEGTVIRIDRKLKQQVVRCDSGLEVKYLYFAHPLSRSHDA